MILHLPAGSPPLVQDLADLALVLHISGGGIGIAAGAAAFVLPKGGVCHRAAGQFFGIGMLVMASIGAVVSPTIGQPTNALGGVLVYYLVLTGWAAARREESATLVDCGLPGLAFCLAAGGAVLTTLALKDPAGPFGGVGFAPPLVFSVVAAAAGTLDIKALRRGGPAGPHRLARHLWRMGAALLIASASLFLGQPKVFPPALRGSALMFVPEILILAAMTVWLARLRPSRRPRPERGAAAGTVPHISPIRARELALAA